MGNEGAIAAPSLATRSWRVWKPAVRDENVNVTEIISSETSAGLCLSGSPSQEYFLLFLTSTLLFSSLSTTSGLCCIDSSETAFPNWWAATQKWVVELFWVVYIVIQFNHFINVLTRHDRKWVCKFDLILSATEISTFRLWLHHD